MADWTVQRILDADLCAGCGACVAAVGNGAMQMELREDGFLRPVPNRPLAAEEEARVRAVCPGIHLAHAPELEPGTTSHAIWGPVRKVYAGHAVDAEVRHRGSSGGVLSALLIHLLESKAVEFIVQTRSARRSPLHNDVVFSRCRDEVLSAAGSRYAPAAPASALEWAFAEGGRFAFVGKPCDVAAVRKYLVLRPELAERVPYLLSFMCAGTPSQHGTEEILRRMQLVPEEVVDFRYRGDGWPGKTRASTVDGRSAELDYNTAWGRILNRHLQTRCKLCADGTGEFADVVCADAWYGQGGYPEFDERDGRSLLVSRTRTGDALIDKAMKLDRVQVEEFDLQGIHGIQPYQHKRKSELLARMLGRQVVRKGVPRYVRMGIAVAATKSTLKANARAFFGSVARSWGVRK